MQGLILAGGNSSRMGREKPFLPVGNSTFYLHAKQLLEPFCQSVYISCSPENQHLFQHEKTIVDEPKFAKNGPIGAILSAFNHHSGPWFVLGCDYPFLDKNEIEYLIFNRELQSVASLFYHAENEMPEPLIGIYECASFEKLLHFFQTGNSSLRVFLTQNDANFIASNSPEKLTSIDTPELYQRMKGTIK